MPKDTIITQAKRSFIATKDKPLPHDLRRLNVTMELAAIGKQAPYFSITGEAWYKGSRGGQDNPDMCGCIHDVILAAWPEAKVVVDVHLCNEKGEPMHVIENAVYHLKKRDTKALANHLRIEQAVANDIVANGQVDLARFIGEQAERWQAEAAAARAFIEQWSSEKPTPPDDYITQLIARLGITLRIVSDEYLNIPVNGMPAGSMKYTCQLKCKEEASTMSTFFYMGPGLMGQKPTAHRVLESLASDASFGLMSFEEFCSAMGEQKDAKSRHTHTSCVTTVARLRKLLGDEEFEKLVDE
jgi:hypothetical protein